MSEIKPIDLPSAAGLAFGRGDVRHFSEDDAVDVPGLQNPTRHLAERDNLLALKMNEVVGVLNNREQFVPISLPRTTIPPGTEEVVTNFKIPVGFEARILNAAIGSVPASSALLLKIYYATGYGNTAGTELVSTTNVFSSGVAFYNDGEFIVAVRNSGSVSLDAAVSITATVRPIGSTAGLLVGSVIKGDKGNPGREGGKGGKGEPGPGGAGTPGMIWSGAFNSANTYNAPQVVSHVVSGITSSYIAKIANPAPSVAPPDGTYWDVIALGSSGVSGAGLNWRNAWLAASTYAANDAVTDTVGGNTNSYVCILAVGPVATHPGADPTHWDVLASGSGGETPVYNITSLPASYSSTATSAADSGYGAVTSGPSAVPASEFSIVNTVGTYKGLVFFYGCFLINLPAGAVLTVTLPVSTAVSASQWLNTEVALNAAAHGDRAVEGGTSVKLLNVARVSTDQWTITSLAAATMHVDVTFFGMKVK